MPGVRSNPLSVNAEPPVLVRVICWVPFLPTVTDPKSIGPTFEGSLCRQNQPPGRACR